MKLRMLLTLVLSPSLVIWGQHTSDTSLAHALADSRTRSRAVAEVMASNGHALPLLMSWAQKPPTGVDPTALAIGLCDVFAELKVKEAVPFLIRNIGLSRDNRANIWQKSSVDIDREFPAAAALIKIGPESANAVIDAYWGTMSEEERHVAMYVFARLTETSPNAVPNARTFLNSALIYLRMERDLAEEALKALDKTGR